MDPETDIEITYSIVSGNTLDEAFAVDPMTGELYLTKNVNYDQTDGKGFFELRIQASDNGSPPQTADVVVNVIIRDENDHEPVFDVTTYYGTVSEVSPPDTTVVTVAATDSDAGQNGVVNYVVQSGAKDNFQVDFDTGLITVATGADLDIERFGDNYRMIVSQVLSLRHSY